jgi:hypothetical protein
MANLLTGGQVPLEAHSHTRGLNNAPFPSLVLHGGWYRDLLGNHLRGEWMTRCATAPSPPRCWLSDIIDQLIDKSWNYNMGNIVYLNERVIVMRSFHRCLVVEWANSGYDTCKKGVREMGSKWFFFSILFSPLTNSLLVEYETCD